MTYHLQLQLKLHCLIYSVSSDTRHFCSCLERNTRNRLDELVQVILDRDRAKTLEIIRSEATQLQDSKRIKGKISILYANFAPVNKIHDLGVRMQHRKALELDLSLCTEVLDGDSVVTGLYLVESSSTDGVSHRVIFL